MKHKCRTCSREYRLEPPYVDGQEIICPYCNATDVYRAPTRIEIPAGARRPADAGAAPAMQPVSRLHVIRPGESSSSQSTKGGNALVDRVTRRARAEARRKLFRKFGVVIKDFFWLLVLVALVVGGWRVYQSWRRHEARPTTPSEPVREAPAEKPPVDAAVTPVEAPPPKAVPKAPPRPEEIIAETKKARVSFYGRLPASERLGAAEGRFTLAIPYGGAVVRYYGIDSSPTGVVAVFRCFQGKPVERVPVAEYEKELKRQIGATPSDEEVRKVLLASSVQIVRRQDGE